MRDIGDLGLLDPGRADIEVELAVGATDAGVLDSQPGGDRRQDLGRDCPDHRRPHDPEAVLSVGDAARLRHDRAGQLRRLMDDQVGTPRLHERLEVLDHSGGPDAREEAGKLEWHSVRRRDVGPARCGRHEPRLGIRLVESSGIGLEPDVPNMAAEARIGRERDAMTGCLESARQRNHRVEVAVTDHAGEEDLHPADSTSSESRV